MGSYPRVLDKKGAHDLYGPVNKLYCTAYDRAMTLYLACLKVGHDHDPLPRLPRGGLPCMVLRACLKWREAL